MALKALSRNKPVCNLVFAALCFIGCSNPEKEDRAVVFNTIDASAIPNVIVFANDNQLKLENGICYFDGKPFSGFVKENYGNNVLKSVNSYYIGKLHGQSKSYYTDGKCRDIRNYKDNLSYGKQIGYWENGNQKFEFTYRNDKREGIQKQWYEDGKPYTFQTFFKDSENGMQKAWRQNGKLFANYEVKGGICYGLQKTNLCYTLRKEKIK